MKYKILSTWKRKWLTESELPVVTVIVKFVTETGYKGTLELPPALVNPKYVKDAIKKDISNAKKVCTQTPKSIVIYKEKAAKKEKS